MDYIALLSATVRLLDLHDSQRSYGGNPNFTEEVRAGHGDGRYLNVAFSIIEQLRDLDQTSGRDYLPFSVIYQHVREDCGERDEDVVQFALNVLRRPTEIFYIDRSPDAGNARNSEKRKTAIIEKTDYADEYRLSPSGRLFFTLSGVARDALYLRGDAYNLLHAIEYGDFHNVQKFADELVGILRTEILDISAILEKIENASRVERYLEKLDQYRKVVEDSLEIIRKAEERLSMRETLDSFFAWQEKTNADLTFDGLRANIKRVWNVLDRFNRLLGQLISLSLQGARTAAPPPSFLRFANALLRLPLPEHEDHLLRQWGPVGLETPFHSVLDGFGAIRIQPEPKITVNDAFDDQGSELISSIGRLLFLERHGAAIAARLKQGPLPLYDAIDAGWFLVDDDLALGDLFGIFTAPDSLLKLGDIEIRISTDINKRDTTKGAIFFTDIELAIKNGGNV
ncbi:MAG: hypothetical protein PHD65_10455 [Gallionella sp.]|nr:hypothetical protein [Gallionella sp.]